MRTNHDSSEDLARAKAVIPGGVNSPVRAFNAVGGKPPFIAGAHGAYVKDRYGREYVDLVGSWGPAILGHAHPGVVEAVVRAARGGLSFGAATLEEVELAEEISARVAPAEKVRLVSSGTEATMTAIRLARGFTGRDKIIKFAGHYHGHSDSLLVEAGSGVASLAIAGSAGIPESVAAQTIVVDYNDLAGLAEAFEKYGSQIAAVIAEPAAANMGVVAPDAGFNAAVAKAAHEAGALFIADEVLTGFRVGKAGWWGLEGGWQPDLFTFGKVIGGGMPLAALAGRAEVMDYLAPVGPVYQAGTLAGNPLAVAAGRATLQATDESVYSKVGGAADELAAALEDAFEAASLPAQVSRAGNLFSLVFGDAASCGWESDRPRNYREVRASEHWRYGPFFHAMAQAGVYLPPSPFEAWFLSAAHDEAAMERITRGLGRAVTAAAAATQDD